MDAPKTSIALTGRSGSGKTEVARHLVSRYGYHRCSPGDLCRHICKTLFNSENRSLMNQVTEAVRSIREDAWLTAALLNAPAGKELVYDSMRFECDYARLK